MEKSNYSVDQLGSNLNELQIDLATTKANLDVQKDFNDHLFKQLEGASGNLTKCILENGKLTNDLDYLKKSYESNLNQIQEDLDKKEEEIQELKSKKGEELKIVENSLLLQLNQSQTEMVKLQEDFDKFIYRMARNVCCKQKVDNNAIKSYEVINGELVCLEKSGKLLNCWDEQNSDEFAAASCG
ncbi:MAG: hypothetical protein KKA62_00510 [Nanoarchaeota archaeon]|nr:hypothetical protein [Nanoarchaeota archaeon]MBU1644395.1 hypothetical protein [Nanoarchaeota archaeon]MBU1976418.1 hypothetical protein [Nanoarchaeota archaeon]